MLVVQREKTSTGKGFSPRGSPKRLPLPFLAGTPRNAPRDGRRRQPGEVYAMENVSLSMNQVSSVEVGLAGIAVG